MQLETLAGRRVGEELDDNVSVISLENNVVWALIY